MTEDRVQKKSKGYAIQFAEPKLVVGLFAGVS